MMRCLQLSVAVFLTLATTNLVVAQSSINVVAPNGGESIDGCTPFLIEWEGTNTSNEFSIDYSTDGGQTWVSLASFLTNATEFEWEAPNTYTNGGLVRVYDAQFPDIYDDSDAAFSISAPLQLTYPNGGEVLFTEELAQIGFIAESFLGPVELQLSTNNGLSWTSIATNQTGGLFEWEVTNTPSTEAIIRVGTDFDGCFVDESNAPFTIVSEVAVEAPNGSEAYQATVVSPSFGGYYLMNNATISTDGGRFFDSGGEDASDSGVNFEKYFWPATPNNELKVSFTRLFLRKYGNGYPTDRLRVYDATTNQQLVDFNGTQYTVDQLHQTPRQYQGKGLKFVFTNASSYGGPSDWDANIESIDVTYDDTTHPIDWDVQGTSKEFHLDYSFDGGLTWNRIISNYFSPDGHYDWPVPNTPSTSCLVKVTDTENNQVLDISDQAFEILQAQPRMTHPNGGEQWYAGTEHDVQWVSDFYPSTTVDLSYSLDGGANWLPLASDVLNDGDHSWLLPSTPSTTARVRVIDGQDSTWMDDSDADFTIIPHLTLLSPNGGQTLDGCSSTNISWDAGGTSGTYDLELSLDGGASWSSLTTGLTSTSWSWPVIDNVTTDSALIRVLDAEDYTKQDQSDAFFSLLKTTDVVMLAPNGGEVWYTGDTHQLNYLKASSANNINLSYSINGGDSWSTIATNQNGGSYTWEVPNTPTTNALLRVQDQSVSCRVDLSDAPFTIVSEVTVEAPNGSEAYQATVVPPSFGGYYIMDNGTISTDGGRFFDSGGEDASDSGVNFEKYFWPATPNNELKVSFTRLFLRKYGNGYPTDRLRVYDATTNQQLVDFNGTQYTVDQLHQTPRQYQGKGLKFVFTNASSYGGPSDWDANIESIDVTYDDTTHPIDWDVQGTSKEFHLDYSFDGGLTWNRIISNYFSPDGHYDWPVPNTPSTSCLVKVTDTENNQVLDISDQAFEILQAQPRMTHPNGGEQWYAGTEHDVQWVSDFYPSTTVDLSYSLDGGANWLPLASDVLNDGDHSWLLPSTPSTTARVRVIDGQDSTWMDDSDADFTIIPHLTLLSPNGGQTLDGCSSTNISWDAGGTSGTYDLELSLDGGASWSSLTTGLTSTSWSWPVIDNVTTDSALIRVLDAEDYTKQDQSDAFFSLLKTTDVVMLAPNGGEVWYTGDTHQLNYLKASSANNINLSYSINGGDSWSTIATNQNGGSYTWEVPNTPTTNALLRVQDQSVSCRVDLSDAPFTIVSEVTVEAPNGSEAYQATVVPPSFGGYYIMDNGTISTDGGRFFDSGGEDASDSGVNFEKYFWPATPNNELKVSFTRLFLRKYGNGYPTDRLRVYDATTNQQLVDFNGTQYTVDQLHQTPRQYQGKGLKFVFTNASSYGGPSDWDANIESIDVTYDDTTHPIDWDVQGTSKEFHLDYSFDGGLTWNRIISNYFSPDGHYDWPVPNTPSTSCLVKVTDTENNQVLDISDQAFEILQAQPRMTHPNGGEQWYAGTEHDVQWVSDFYPSTTVDLSYSLDGGANWLPLASDVLNDGDHSWLLPSTPSTTARVRVIDGQDSTWMDDSDADFTIIPHLTLLSPNGGQTLDGCSSTNISWDAGGTSGTYDLELSLDGGASWSSLTTGLTSTSWSWPVIDNVTTDSALIRVLDAEDYTKQDQSDAFFSLLKTTDVVMLAPNGGEVWYTGDTHQLNYLKASSANNINLSYSINGGDSWSTIATNQNGGSYTWEVPNTPTTNALLRVQDQSVSCRVDLSDAPFTIVSEVTVEAPNGSEAYQATVVPPSFGGYYIMDNGTISTDGGRFFDSGGEDASDSGVNFEKYFWPATPNNELKVSFTRLFLRKYGNGYPTDRLRVYDATTNQQLVDFNGTQYTVDQLHQTPRQYQGKGLKFVFTNASSYGGPSDWDANIESIDVTYDDTTHPIDWDVQGTSKEFHLDYSFDGGLTWNRIISNYFSPDGHYDWPVPNTPSTSCLVKVTDTENNQVLDISDQAFEILQAQPRMTHPNGGEQWYAGTEHDVQWVSDFYPSTTVDLSYSLDGGANWLPLASDVLNDGDHSWLLPSTPSTTARVRVIDGQDSTWMDDSDADFTIIPHLTLLSPNGGQTLDGCSSTNISWDAGGTSGTYDLELSLDGGASWSSLTTGLTSTSWSWPVIDNVTTDSALIRVLDAEDYTKQDQSDAFFSLLKTTDVVMLAPNGGEVWYTGDTHQLNYLKASSANNINLSYSINGGDSWSTIATNQNGGSYTWEVPNTPTTNALLRVQDQSVSCRVDLSDAPFTIVSEVTVEAPNGSEAYQATVVPPSFGGYYIMDNGTISTDGGRFFDSGGEDASDSGVNFEKYFWPATPNNELKVSFTRLFLRKYGNGYPTDRLRVYDATTNQQLVDFNGTQYTVDQLHQTPRQYQGKGLKFVFTNASSYGGPSDWDANIESIDVTYDDTTHPIDWDVQGTSKEFHLDYSFDGGLTWNRIISNYFSPDGHYDWPVPNTPSTSCLVKVTDTENNQVLDISDQAFEILQAQPRMTHPNGGEQWYAGTEHDVQWVSDFYPSTTVDLSYSLDGGANWLPLASDVLNDGDHSWLLPSTPSTTARVRVIDGQDSTWMDDSDADFTIIPHLTLLSPNGGQTLDGCSSTNISWDAGGTSGTYDLELSLDGGASWSSLTTGLTSTSWSWPVIDNVTTDSALIRVLDAEDYTKQDQSDAFFSLLKTTDVVMLAPNGGEVWYTGDTHQLNYLKASSANNINLSYSINGGDSWSTIATNQNGGSYTWEVPNTPTTNALLRVQDQSVSCRVDLSDAPFTIVSEVTVEAPNGSEAYQATVVPPSFGGYYIMDNGTISTDGGRFFDSGGEDASDSGVNFEKYFWPATPNNELKVSFTRLFLRKYGNGYPTDRLRVYDATTNQQLVDFNGTQYTVDQLHQTPRQYQGKGLKFVFTNASSYGGPSDWDANIESIDVTYDDTTHPIDWDVQGTSKEFHLDYSFDGGLTWNRIISNYFSPDGHYDWPVPNTPSTSCLVKVTDTENNQVLDISDQAFEILPGVPFVEVEYPNTATAVFIGSITEVQWESRFLESSQVAIDYSTNNGETWSVVSDGTPNDGTHDWLVPDAPTSVALIRVRDLGNGDNFDVSDIGFTISPPISLQTQNTSNADYRACTFTNIDWFAGGTSGTYDIDYSVDGGENWISIESGWADDASFINYAWLVPNTPSEFVKVRVTDALNPTKTDQSENLVQISPTLELTSWTYGGIATSGSNIPITWQDTLTSNFFNVYYSTDNGDSWINIVQDHYTLNGFYDWTVPTLNSNVVKVKVEDANNDCKGAESTLPFEVSAFEPTIQILSPNGGESYNGCNTVTVTWTDESSETQYNIEYRNSPESNWIPLASGFDAPNHEFNWELPNESILFGTIRVRSFSNSNNYDVSDYHFTTSPSIDATISAENGSFNACAGDTLTLLTVGAFNHNWSTGVNGLSIEVHDSGIYSLTTDNGAGCSSTTSVEVIFQSAPPSPLILFEGPSIVCEGQSVTMTAEGEGAMYWPQLGINTNTVQVATSGTYFAVATNNGCSSTSNDAEVQVNPTPILESAASNSPVLEGNVLDLSVSVTPENGTTVLWEGPSLFAASGTQVSIESPSTEQSGVYQVYAERLGCGSDTLFTIVQITEASGNFSVLTGSVFTPSFQPLGGVSITATNAGNASESVLSSDENGTFFGQIPENQSYYVTASKPTDVEPSAGLSTLDILLAQADLLGIQPLNDPLAQLAADANGSGNVSTLDLLLIQQVILQLADGIPGTNAWEIIPNQDWSGGSDPNSLESSQVIPASGPLDIVDFTAVKRGDVNFSWTQSNVIAPESQIDLTWEATSIGDVITAKLSFESPCLINGIQFTVEWPENWTMSGWSSSIPLNVNSALTANGQLPVQYATSGSPYFFTESAAVLELQFTAPDAWDIQQLQINSSIAKEEICDAELNVFKPSISVTQDMSGLTEELVAGVESLTGQPTLSIYPNPARNTCYIKPPIGRSNIKELQFINASGQLVAIKSYYEDSNGTIQVAMDLPSGLYAIQCLFNDGFIATEQIMIER